MRKENSEIRAGFMRGADKGDSGEIVVWLVIILGARDQDKCSYLEAAAEGLLHSRWHRLAATHELLQGLWTLHRTRGNPLQMKEHRN